jgi:hypothetical protein
MSFKERFKGKTTKIGKEGMEAVICESNSPIQKDSMSKLYE